jgi:hypothetical protein
MLARIVDNTIDRVGDWNPQLFRELATRITPRTLVATVSLSLGSELLMLGMVGTQGLVTVNNWLNGMMMLVGIYALISDIAQERKSGTFDFIRLTPQSGRSIFIGKLLGVPILIYLISLVINLTQAIVLLLNGVAVSAIAGWFLSLGGIYYATFSTAILMAAVGHRSAILTTMFIGSLGSFALLVNHLIISSDISSIGLQWYLFALKSPLLIGAFLTLSCWLWGYWCWVGIDRKYININSSLFTKANNYIFNLCFNLWLLGFCTAPFIDAMTTGRVDYIVYATHICNFLSAVWIGVFQSWAIPRPVNNPEWQRIEFIPVDLDSDPAIVRQEKTIFQAFFPTDSHISEDILLFVNSLYYGIFWSLPMVIFSPLSLWYQVFICIFINLFISMTVWVSSFAIYTLIFNRTSLAVVPYGEENRNRALN